MNNDLISRSALKEALDRVQYTQEFCIEHQIDYSISMQMVGLVINNAPTVEPEETCMVDKSNFSKEQYKADIDNAYNCGYEKGKNSRPQNKWIKIFENPFTNGYVCPFCGHKIQVTEQFLPEVTECESCGADMRKPNCVRCDLFGKCDGCEKGEEE